MAEFDSKDFGERLKNYRIQKGLSQENMAILLNKNRSTIARYEAGEILPDVRDIRLTYMGMILIEQVKIINLKTLLVLINCMSILMRIILEQNNLHPINIYYN